LLPCGLSPTCGSTTSLDRSQPVSRDSHDRSRSCQDPPSTMGPLFTGPKARFPVALGQERLTRSLPPTQSTSKPYLLHESVPHATSCPVTPGRCSPGLSPLQSFPTCASGPQTHPSFRSRACRVPWYPGHRQTNPRTESTPGLRCETHMPQLNHGYESRSTATRPSQAGPHRLSATPLLSWPFTTTVAAVPGLQSLQVHKRCRSPQRSTTLLRFPTSSKTSLL